MNTLILHDIITMAANMLISKVKISRRIIGFHRLCAKKRFLIKKCFTKIYLGDNEKKNRNEPKINTGQDLKEDCTYSA